jgi:hypothetical protein
MNSSARWSTLSGLEVSLFTQLAMPKAEGENQTPATEGPVKSAAETTPEPIPPVHVLEAAQQQERKETDDLLAGFDKPGRNPRRNPSGDFVDYYSKKKDDRGTPSNPSREVRKGRPDASTVVIPRKKATPAWVAYAGVAAVMATLAGAIAYVATDGGDARKTAPTASAPSTSLPVATTTTTIDIPPPDPPEPVVASADPPPTPTSAPPPTARKKRDPSPMTSTISAQPSSTPPASSPTTTPSNGYIRNLLPTTSE